MKRMLKRMLLAQALLLGGVSVGLAQTGGPVNVRASDTSTGASTEVGDNTNHAIRVNIVAGASSGGTAAADNAAFTQGTTNETPVAGLYATSWSNPTAGHNSIFRMDVNGGIYANLDKVGTNAILTGNGTTGTGSLRVTIASDNTAFSVNALQSGTWNVGTLTSITNAVLTKPIDACGTTNEDFQALIADTTLDTVTSTTTCVDSITISNKGSAATTVLVQDISGTPLVLVPTTPIAPNGSLIITGLAGVKMTSGIKIQANNANNLTYWIKARQ